VYAQGDSWTKIHKVRVRGLDDFSSDGKMPFRVVCTAASLDTKYSSLNIPSIGLENEDNDNSQLNVYFSSILWTGESNGAQLQYRNPFPVDETGAKRYMYVNLPRAPACPETCTAAGACSAAAQGCQASVTVETWSDDTDTGTINSNGFTFTTSNWNQNKYQVIEITGIDNDYVGCGPMRAIPCEKDCGVVVSKGEGTDRCNTDTDRDTMFQIRLTMESVDLFFDGVDTSFSVWNIDDELLQLSKSACTVAEYGSSCSFGILQAWRFLNDLLSASDAQETSLMHSVVIHATSTNVLEGVIRPATDAIGTKIEDDGSITFVFTQDDWWVARNLTVTGVDDFVADGPQVFKVTVNSTITYKRGAGTTLEDVSPVFQTQESKHITGVNATITNLDDDHIDIIVVQQFETVVFSTAAEVATVGNSTNGTDGNSSSVLLPVPVDADVNTSALVTANETAGNIPENAAMHGNITRTVPIVTDEDGTKSNWFKVKLSSQPRALVMVPIIDAHGCGAPSGGSGAGSAPLFFGRKFGYSTEKNGQCAQLSAQMKTASLKYRPGDHGTNVRAVSELDMYYIASRAMCASVAIWHSASAMAKGGQ